MKWTTTPPTESGWYWLWLPGERPAIVPVYMDEWRPYCPIGARWAGPIPLPEEDRP